MKIKLIPGFDGFYKISEDGQVWSRYSYDHSRGQRKSKTWKLRRVTLSKGSRYLSLLLSKNGKPSLYSIHRLVLTAFKGPCPDGKEGRHLDGDRLNNHISNLEWSSHIENELDKHKHGTITNGDKNGNSKLTKADVLLVMSLRNRHKWKLRAIAILMDVHVSTIKKVMYKRSWIHIHKEVA